MKINPPTNCPSCDSLLVIRNDVLYCVNKDCSAVSFKRVEHFAKTMKIKGLGPSTIEKLELNNIEEIYDIDVGYITFCLKSGKLAVKLFEEIEKSKNQRLNTLLPAFGIPLIGGTAAAKLSAVCGSIHEINPDTCKAAGLGPKATSNLLEWLEHDFHRYAHLPFSFEFEGAKPVASENKGVVCISGKLKSFKTKAEATVVLEALGYTVKGSLTKDVTILLNESGVESAKTQKADTMGVRVINNIQELMENN